MLEEQKESADTKRRVLVLWHECDGETEARAIERTKREQGLTDEEFARAAVGTVCFVAARYYWWRTDGERDGRFCIELIPVFLRRSAAPNSNAAGGQP